MMSMPSGKQIVVIGGGAAGLMAAGTALRSGAQVTIFEHMPRIGTKLLITGKGRCNVTNDCTPEEFLKNVISNPRFLYSAASDFTPSDTQALFEELGVPLKVERGQRVFPVSDKAADIVSALRRYTDRAVVIHEKVTELLITNGRISGVKTAKKSYDCDAVILATGGASYPLTGSDGSGYALAQQAGHTITPLSPSLVPLVSHESCCAEMQGLSLRNVKVRFTMQNKVVYTDFGEMLFTHFGLSGPVILSASAHLRGYSFDNAMVHIDLKPALDDAMLEARLLSDFKENANKDLQNELAKLLPQKMILPFAAKVGIDPHKKVHDITKEERKRIFLHLRAFPVTINGFRPLREAIVTAGGVNVKEVNPKTMESKITPGLYFAGEILDLDAYTGGFNLQIAFCTAHRAAVCAADTTLS